MENTLARTSMLHIIAGLTDGTDPSRDNASSTVTRTSCPFK